MTLPVTGIAPPSHDAIDGYPHPAEAVDLFGHTDASAAITGAYRAGRLHHAFILAGPKGIGKATLAYRIARYLATYPDHETAPEQMPSIDTASAVYRQIASQAHHGTLAIARRANDSGGFKTQVTVDEIRRIGAFLAHRSHDNAWRTVIVDAADEMNRNAANALLKNLEEPPPRTLFLLVTHQLSRLLPTIRSRCQVIRMSPLSDADMVAALGRLAMALPQDGDALQVLLAKARGSVRMAILMAEYGGKDIDDAIVTALGGGAMDLRTAHALGGSLAGKGMEMQFGLFCDFLRERFEARARSLAANRGLTAAVRAAEASAAFESSLRETEIYNLDRKQFVVSALAGLRAAMVDPAGAS